MTSTDRQRGHSALDSALDIFRVRQYFNVIVRARDAITAVRADTVFLDTVRRGLLPLPSDRQPAAGQVFGELRGTAPPPLAGRVGVVVTGGSGALASLVGVAKALEDSGTEVSVYSVCSGSALFGFPLGAGMPPDEVAELTASMRPADYIDVGWRQIAALVPTLARGWCGILRGDKLEAFYRGHFGDLTLAQLRTPTYAPIWNVEHNRLDFVGPRTYPDMPVARAIRMAVSLPLFVQPVVLDGLAWCDGGIVDIFPVRPCSTSSRRSTSRWRSTGSIRTNSTARTSPAGRPIRSASSRPARRCAPASRRNWPGSTWPGFAARPRPCS